MKQYKTTTEQAQELQNVEYKNDVKFFPFQDINGDYFISTQEVNDCINPQYMWVKNLPLVEFIPPELPPQ